MYKVEILDQSINFRQKYSYSLSIHVYCYNITHCSIINIYTGVCDSSDIPSDQYCVVVIYGWCSVAKVLITYCVRSLTLLLLREIEEPWKQITGSQLIMLPLFLLSYISGLYPYPRGRLFTKLLPYVIVAILFILFVLYNGSIVVG